MTIQVNNENDYALDRLHRMSIDNSFVVTNPDEVLKNYRKLTIDKFIVFLYSLLSNKEMILENPVLGQKIEINSHLQRFIQITAM